MTERERIAAIARILEAARTAGVRVGIGDDAAILEPGSAELVWTIDAQVEGVHFDRRWLSWEDIGYRAVTTAASDLAAMGATPRALLAALILPPDVDDAALAGIAAGQAEAAKGLGTAVVGGNLSRGSELSITTTALGEARRPLTRAGARPGDVVAVSGPLGLARVGLESLRAGDASDAAAPARAAWRRPTARIDAGLAAAPIATAAIDISDGLALDAARLAEASEVRITLSCAALIAHGGATLAAASAALGLDPIDVVLHGGEDHAILIATPEGAVPAGFSAIGWCEYGAGVQLEEPDGAVRPLATRGFDHFA